MIMRLRDRIFGSPYFYGELLFVARYGALLQMVGALFFLGWSKSGGPLGCLETARLLSEASLATLTLGVCIGIFAHFLRKCGVKF